MQNNASISLKRFNSSMASLLARKDPDRDRHSILRGVYEENLAILGKRQHPFRSLRRPSVIKRSINRVLLYASGCFLAFFISDQYKDSTASSALTVSMKPAFHKASTTLTNKPIPAHPANTAELKRLKDNANVPLSRMLGLGVRRIVIDAGHGGSDKGAVGRNGTLEKNITLDIARRVKAHLLKSGFPNIRMTREDDSLVTLQDRVTFVREAKADLLLSIHINWLPNSPMNAIETYYFGPSKDQGTIKLAESENSGSEYGLSEFREILEKLGTDMKLQESRKLAEVIQANLFSNSQKKNENVKDLGIKRAPFVVLLGPDIPAVLAEVSCLSNPKEERELNSEIHRENIACYLADGIINYLNEGVSQNGFK